MGSIRTTTGEKPPPTANERRNRKWRFGLMTVMLVLLVGVIGQVIPVVRYAPASGYATTAGYAEVRAATTGQIAAILKTSGDQVEQGEILLQLDDEAERANLAEAENQVAKSEAELAFRKAAVADNERQHANRIKAAEMEVTYAGEKLQLTRQLHERGLASGRQLSDDQFGLARFEEALRALREIDLSVEKRQLDVLQRETEARRDALARARAALEQRAIRAPIAGRLVRYTFYVGELVRPDMVLYEVFDGEVDMLKLLVPERYAVRVRPGMRVDVQLGTYRTLLPTRFSGTVEILRDVVEGDGTRNYRVAYCNFNRSGHEVAPGTSAEARIRIGRSSVWNLLLQP